jgi:hypothetical protein
MSLTRLATLAPFEEAKASLDELLGVHVSASLARRACLQAGRASVQVQNEQANPQAQVREEPPAQQMVMSTDGAFVALTSGEWAEIKLLSLGEVDAQAEKVEEVHTINISYFGRLEEASVFSDQVSGEIRRRGIERAPSVCAVQDGALWLQQVVQDHRQDALRILDFAHAAEYISAIGEAVQARGWHLPAHWLQSVLHRLKHDGPDRVLEHLHWLCKRLNDPEITKKERYLSRRREQMRYPVFREAGWPIGSGMVESGHKVVMQARLKGAGMRWERNTVNPMLALRMALCNDRWLENWQQQWTEQQTTREQRRWHHQQQRVLKRQEHAKEVRTQVAPPPPPPSVPIEPEKKGRTESQKQWGRRTFSTRVLRQGS